MIALNRLIVQLLGPDRPPDGLPTDKTLRVVHRLSPKGFQLLCADLFGKLGFYARTSKYTEISGVRMIALKNNEAYLIQCRRAGPHEVHLEAISDFFTTMEESGCSRGFFVSTGFFSDQARAFIADKPIELINGRQLIDYLEHLKIGPHISPATAKLRAG